MPRPQRPDLHPTIWLPDTRDAQRRADAAVGPNLSASVYRRGRTAPYLRVFAAFHDWMRFLRSEGEKIDHEILFYMLGQLQFADAQPIGNTDDRGLIPHRMHMPGCRAQLLQKEIAVQLGCSDERVRQAIKQMRICGIIVNDGHGWYEFDATFFWKGKEQYRLAYTPIQQALMSIEVV